MSFERYSAEARRAVELAAQEARHLGHGRVGTEHLLLGLLGERNTPAGRALAAGGASLALCREKVTEALANRPVPPPRGEGKQLPLTDRATRAIDRANRLAARLGSEDVLTEHLLLSLLDVEGTAGQVLRGQSVDLAAVRKALSSPASSPTEASLGAPLAQPAPPLAAEPAPPSAVGPLCGKCEAPLDKSLGRTTFRSGEVVVFYCTACGTAIGAAPTPAANGRLP